MSKPTKTHKLGPIPKDKDPVFDLPVRMPGWHPDADDKGVRDELFIEEVVGKRKADGKLLPFPAPSASAGGHPLPPFMEPDPGTATPTEWQQFNKWILGGPIYPVTSGEPALTKVLRDLAVLARRYNAALYRMRRLHFYDRHTPGTTDPKPPHNPKDGKIKDTDDLTDTGTRQRLIQEAKEDWLGTGSVKGVVNEINDYIGDFPEKAGDPITVNHGLVIVAADMVEVNGYIVSMRIVACEEKDVPGRIRKEEVGGSSSSHVSISSAFSSPGA